MLPDRSNPEPAKEPPGHMKRDPVYVTFPGNGGTESVDAGDLMLDFITGKARMPNGDEKTLSARLEGSRHGHVSVIAFDRPDQNIDVSLDGGGYFRIEANCFRAIRFPCRKVAIRLTATTNIRVYAATDDSFLYAEGPPATVPTPYWVGTEKINFTDGFGLAGTITTTPTDIDFIVSGNLDNPITDNDDIVKVMLVCQWRFENSFNGANGFNILVATIDNLIQMNAGAGFQDVDQLTDDFANVLAQNDMFETVTIHDITDILTDLSATISLRLSQARADANNLYVFLTPWIEVLFKSS